MFAAGAAIQLGLVAAGMIVVLGALWASARRSGSSAPPPAPERAPVRRLGPPALRPERRGVARAPVARPVVVRRNPADPTDEQRTFALDVGLGGALLAGPADLAIGDVLDLLLDVGQPVAGRARVVRETPAGMKGVAFEELAEADRERLERYVAATQPA